MRTKQIFGFDVTESLLTSNDSGDQIGGAWGTTWARARLNNAGTIFWQITLNKGTYLIVIDIIGGVESKSVNVFEGGVMYVAMSTDAATDDSTGINVDSILAIPINLGGGSLKVVGGTHMYKQQVSAGGQTFTVKRLASGFTDLDTTSASTTMNAGVTVDSISTDGSVIRAIRIGG